MEEGHRQTEEEKQKTEATDLELALFLVKHLDNPCEIKETPGELFNLRQFYLREARGALLKIKDPEAKRFLELKIKQYEED